MRIDIEQLTMEIMGICECTDTSKMLEMLDAIAEELQSCRGKNKLEEVIPFDLSDTIPTFFDKLGFSKQTEVAKASRIPVSSVNRVYRRPNESVVTFGKILRGLINWAERNEKVPELYYATIKLFGPYAINDALKGFANAVARLNRLDAIKDIGNAMNALDDDGIQTLRRVSEGLLALQMARGKGYTSVGPLGPFDEFLTEYVEN